MNPCFRVEGGTALVAVPRDAKRICIEFPGGEGWNPGHGGGIYGPYEATLDEIAIRLDEGRTVRGRVLDPGGAGLAGVRVSVLPVDPLRVHAAERYEFWYSHFDTRTDAAGRFAIPGLRPGDYVLALAPPPEFIMEPLRWFTLSEEEMVLRLRKGIDVAVRALDDQGKPLAGAAVQARRLEGDPGNEHWELVSQAYTGRDGVARLQGLDPSQKYRLGVDPDSDLRMDLEEKRIHDWEPAETTVQLERK